MTRKWYATRHHPKMHPHIKFGIPTSKNIGDLHRTQSWTDGHCDYYKTRSEIKVKVTVTRKWYTIFCPPKMHPHTKFGNPTSKNIGDMHWAQSGTDGQCNYYMPPKVPLVYKKRVPTLHVSDHVGELVGKRTIFLGECNNVSAPTSTCV